MKMTMNQRNIVLSYVLLVLIAACIFKYTELHNASHKVYVDVPTQAVEQVWISTLSTNVTVSLPDSSAPQKRKWRVPFIPETDCDTRPAVCNVTSKGQAQKWSVDYIYMHGKVVGAEFRKNKNVELLGANERLEDMYLSSNERITQIPDVDISTRIPNIIESFFFEVYPEKVEQFVIWSVMVQGVDPDDADSLIPKHLIIANIFAEDAPPASNNFPNGAAARYIFKNNGQMDSIDNVILASPAWRSPYPPRPHPTGPPSLEALNPTKSGERTKLDEETGKIPGL